jgi:trigger factor
MICNLEYRLSQQGVNRELYLQIRGITEEELDEEMAPLAENRIKRGLVLAEVAKVENLEIDQQQLAAEAGRTMEMITRGMSPKDQKDFQKSNYLMSLVNSIMADMMTQQSMNYLRAIAKGDPLPVKKDEEAESDQAQDVDEVETIPETAATTEVDLEEETLVATAEEVVVAKDPQNEAEPVEETPSADDESETEKEVSEKE